MSSKYDPKKLIVNLAERNKSVPELQFILDDPENYTVKRVGEHGCINIIYRVQSEDEKHSLIVKYSEDTPSFEGLSEEAFGLERQTLEYNCLMTLHNLIPGCVPQPYCLDEQLHIIAMDDLSDMDLLGDVMSRGEINPDFARKLGKLIGKMHVMTHKELVSEDVWKEYETLLKNEEWRDRLAMCNTHHFCEENHPMFAVPEECLQVYQKGVSRFKSSGTLELIRILNAREDCFTHADLHVYSLLFSSQRIAMIDFEFGHLGNHCYTPAFLMANYLLIIMEAQNNNKGQEEEIEGKTKTSIQFLVEGFLSSFGDKIHVLGPVGKLFGEMALFCGHVLFVLPCLVVFDNIYKITPQQKKKSMEMGYTLLKQHQDITSLDQLIDMLFS